MFRREVVNPLKLRGCLRNRFSARGANGIYGLIYADSGSHQHPGRNQSRTPNTLTAMNCNILAFVKRLPDVSQQQECIWHGGRYSAIGNRKRDKVNVVRFCDVAFVTEFQLSRLFLFKQRDDDVKTGTAPTASLVIEPVSPSRASGHSQPAAPRARNPEKVKDHGSL